MTRQHDPDATWGQDLNIDVALRGAIWTPLMRRIRQRWPGVEAWSVLEWGKVTEGVHLHGVVRGTAGITTAWANQVIQALGQPYVAHIESIEDTHLTTGSHADEDVTTYLTKQLRDKDILDGWPPYTHVVSATQNWLPREDRTDIMTEIMAPDRPQTAHAA